MISAKVIADSVAYDGDKRNRITTFEFVMPRWVLAEFNTHRQLSRNSASSRAIPIQSNIDNILANTAMPVHWGLNQSGMVADTEATNEQQLLARAIWLDARNDAIKHAKRLSELGIHKQIANRLIENFTYQKVIATGTEWDNFFWLRYHKDAQPEIAELAEVGLEALNNSKPMLLNRGEWHVPYVKTERDSAGAIMYYDSNGAEIGLEDAIIISASCCAQVSYRKSDDSLEKAQKVFDMLNLDTTDEDTRKHSSPIEHQATPINHFGGVAPGETHIDFDDNIWSGNFKGWIQNRHLYPDESCKNHPEIIK